MKRINFISFLSVIVLSMITINAQAQYDDVYYDPSKDGGTSVEETYTKETKETNNQNNQNNKFQEQPDGTNDKYYEDDEDYDDYDYYYSSRIRRFHRPLYGFDYYDDCYVDSYNYDPFWTGTTIYVGFNSYYDYARWRRASYWGFGPSYYSFGYNPCGWNFGYYSYSPWSYYGYNPYPPYGNIYYNDYYYGNYWGGGYYNHYNNYYDGNNNHNHGGNIHYGPRKVGGGLTELKGNPRGGKIGVTPSNPRGTTNQSPANFPGRNSVRPNTSVPNTTPRGNNDILTDRRPTTSPANPGRGNNVPKTDVPRPGRDVESGRPATQPQSPRTNDQQQILKPRPGRDNAGNQQSTPTEIRKDQNTNRYNEDPAERVSRRQERLRQIYDDGNRNDANQSGSNNEYRTPRQRPQQEVEQGGRNRRIERSEPTIQTESPRSHQKESAPQINRSENNNSGGGRSSGSGNISTPRSNDSGSKSSGSSSPRSGGRR